MSSEPYFYLGNSSCCCNCWYVSDDFNRASSTDLGSKWWEFYGDSFIRYGRLYQPVGGEIAIFQTRAPDSKIVVSVELTGEGEEDPETGELPGGELGSIWRIMLQWDDDEEYPHYYVDIERTDPGGDYVVRIYRSDDPGTPLLDRNLNDDGWAEPDSPEPVGVAICMTPEALVVKLEGSIDSGDWIHWITDPDIQIARPKVGLANGGVVPITFANFTYALHKTGTDGDDGNCPLCICWCDNHVPPPTLTATVTGWDESCYQQWNGQYGDYGCAQADGFSIEMDWDPIEHYWQGTEYFGPGETNEWHAIFECTVGVQDGCDGYRFDIWGDSSNPDTALCCNEAEEHACEPHIHEDQDAYPCGCDPFIWISEDIASDPEEDGSAECVLCTPLYDDPKNPTSTPSCGGYRVTVTE